MWQKEMGKGENVLLTGGRHSSEAISEFLMAAASSTTIVSMRRDPILGTGYRVRRGRGGDRRGEEPTCLAVHQGSQVARAGNGRAAAKRLELGLDNFVGDGVDADVQLHDVAAGGRAHQARADRGVLAVEGADVARAGVVVDQWKGTRVSREQKQGGEGRTSLDVSFSW